jgi:molybdopterin-guanine dinucleotide biosynthesis protein A
VVLAGGAATRMGGAAKPARIIGGTALVARVLNAVADAEPRIVVGPPTLADLLPADVARTIEDPPGGGPVAALAAGLRLVPAYVPVVAVLAADLPFLDPSVIAALRARLTSGVEAAVLVDDQDRPQWLCSAWRRDALAARLPADPSGRAMRTLTEAAVVARVSPVGGAPAWFDCDTDEDIRRAEELADGDAR